jgi:spore maturation protein CgeB
MDDAELRRIATRARERVLDQHSSGHRANELIALLEQTMRRGACRHEAEEA